MVRPLILALALVCVTAAMSQTPLPVHEPAIIGYYAGDGYDIHGRPVEKHTHVIWCFLHLQGDSVMPLDKAQEKSLRKFIGYKREHPGLKVLLSLGGWGGCPSCSEVFSRTEGRKRFASSIHRILKQTFTDGIDLDWEYPAVANYPGHRFAAEDRHNFTLLVRELRAELGDRYEISFAAGGTEECLLQGFEWDSIMPVVDRVHIMSYDLVHGFSTRTGHHTPVMSTAKQAASTDKAVKTLLSAHVPREKIVIGSAFYARVFKDVPPKGNGLFQPGTFSHTVPHSAMDTTITTAKGWTWHRDKIALAPYAFNAREKLFLTCDDSVSVAAKADYVRAQGLGGIMYWQMRDDRKKGGLFDVLYRRLRTP